jgi:hypothetical protein
MPFRSLAAGARVNTRDKQSRTPLCYVPSNESESPVVADLLRRAESKEG